MSFIGKRFSAHSFVFTLPILITLFYAESNKFGSKTWDVVKRRIPWKLLENLKSSAVAYKRNVKLARRFYVNIHQKIIAACIGHSTS